MPARLHERRLQRQFLAATKTCPKGLNWDQAALTVRCVSSAVLLNRPWRKLRVMRITPHQSYSVLHSARGIVAWRLLSVSWIIFHWRQVVPLVIGIIFFGFAIAGLVVNTIFLSEIQSRQQDLPQCSTTN